MERMLFLLSLSVSGIKNIENKIQIEFCGKTVDKSFTPEKYNVKGIYGENGSGKTAIISSIGIVKEFIFNNNYLRDSQNQRLLTELINKSTREFCFRCEFFTTIEHFIIFEYEVCFAFDENDEVYVSRESLSYKLNNRKNRLNPIFLCENGHFLKLEIEEPLRQEIDEKTRNLLTKQSAFYQLFSIVGKDPASTTRTYLFVYSMLFFLFTDVYFDKEDTHEGYLQKIKLNTLKNSLSSDELLDVLWEETPSTGRMIPVKGFSNYELKIKKLESFIRLFKPELNKIIIDKKINKDFFECELILDYGKYKINREFESNGIKKIMELFDAFTKASDGFVIFIDEMDSNINDIYLCKLIEYFKDYGKGQLCFTSHNIDSMTVLKENNKSIDFLTTNNEIVSWVKNGHYTPENSYRRGMIRDIPFNIDSSDFIKVFGRGE